MSRSDSDDWDQHWSGMHRAVRLNPAQDFRRRLILYHLGRTFGGSNQPLRLLDVGCGTGDFARDFKQAFPRGEYTGLDISAVGIELCRQTVPEATFVVQDLVNDASVDPRFQGWATAAVCSEMLEHVDEPERILEHIKPYLAPGASLILTVPGGPMSAFDRHIGHRQHFTNQSVQSLLDRSGYRTDGVWGAGFPFFNIYRMTVIARGRKLLGDVSRPAELFSPLFLAAMTVFGVLFRFNRYRSKLGWQRVAVATPCVSTRSAEASQFVDRATPLSS
jgi:SAM-dependent methyltransferase